MIWSIMIFIAAALEAILYFVGESESFLYTFFCNVFMAIVGVALVGAIITYAWDPAPLILFVAFAIYILIGIILYD